MISNGALRGACIQFGSKKFQGFQDFDFYVSLTKICIFMYYNLYKIKILTFQKLSNLGLEIVMSNSQKSDSVE